MVGLVVEENGVQSIKTLAGGMSDGLPLGTIVAFHRSVVPVGFLACDGSEFDTTEYPSLYTLLGSNHTPDLREASLVGIGLSDRQTISAHDVYTLGQFKDDQVQTINATIDTSGIEITVTDPGHTHNIPATEATGSFATGTDYASGGTAVYTGASDRSSTSVTSTIAANTTESSTTGITAEITDGSVTATFENYRNGATTHGKNYGVQYIIKATTGTIDVNDAEIYAQVVAFVEANYGKDDLENYEDMDLVRWDAENNKFVPVARPTVNGQVLSYKAGSTETHHEYATVITDGTNFYNNDFTSTTEPEGTAGTLTIIGDYIEYNSVWYKKAGSSYYTVVNFSDSGDLVTDEDLISELDAQTLTEYFEVTYDNEITTVIDPTYEWKRNGAATTHIYTTQAAYEAALLIQEGEDGYIADGDIILLEYQDTVLKGVDA